jgi:1,4-dihydroxy-2-naphthoate octaprenyltransferase
VGASLLQIGCNFANDVSDFLSGADTDERLGPARATQKGWLTPKAMMVATAVVLGAALAVGLYLIALGGWPIALIGLTGMVCAVAYTAGPYPLGYHGLGDIVVFVFFGPLAVCGTFYVQSGDLSPAVVLASVPIGLLAAAILVVNNLRDRETDAKVGKRTLAVRWGARGARAEYLGLVALSFGVPLIAVLTGQGSLGWLVAWLALPLGITCYRAVNTLDGEALNPQLGATARLTALYGGLLSMGVWL